MMQTMVSTDVWQRRTHKIIAMAVIIIGLTMMISTIPQCIYIGLVFLMLSLGWLGWMRMKEKKAEPPNPTLHHHHPSVSPVLFLVASQNFTQRSCGPTPVDPSDKPPSYDQILKLDGLPPDYFTILATMPPRYEDIEGTPKHWSVSIPVDVESSAAGLASVHSYSEISSSSGSSSGSFVTGCSSIQSCSLCSQQSLESCCQQSLGACSQQSLEACCQQSLEACSQQSSACCQQSLGACSQQSLESCCQQSLACSQQSIEASTIEGEQPHEAVSPAESMAPENGTKENTGTSPPLDVERPICGDGDIV